MGPLAGGTVVAQTAWDAAFPGSLWAAGVIMSESR